MNVLLYLTPHYMSLLEIQHQQPVWCTWSNSKELRSIVKFLLIIVWIWIWPDLTSSDARCSSNNVIMTSIRSTTSFAGPYIIIIALSGVAPKLCFIKLSLLCTGQCFFQLLLAWRQWGMQHCLRSLNFWTWTVAWEDVSSLKAGSFLVWIMDTRSRVRVINYPPVSWQIVSRMLQYSPIFLIKYCTLSASSTNNVQYSSSKEYNYSYSNTRVRVVASSYE
jgi:hypothetical protein